VSLAREASSPRSSSSSSFTTLTTTTSSPSSPSPSSRLLSRRRVVGLSFHLVRTFCFETVCFETNGLVVLHDAYSFDVLRAVLSLSRALSRAHSQTLRHGRR
jgi:hypothetical protein